MYELIIFYTDGTKETAKFDTKEAAEKAAHNYYLAFGNQIAGSSIRRA